MRILGIHTSHDSGAAVIEDGRVLAAINEERLVRTKLFWGLPLKSVEKVLEISKTKPWEIDYVAIAGITSGGGPHTDFKVAPLRKRVMEKVSKTGIPSTHAFKSTYRGLFSRFRDEKSLIQFLRGIGIRAPVTFIDHHMCHAASAYYTSPFDKDTLVMTTDSSGDGICSIVCTVEGNEIRKRHESTFIHSPGAIYTYVTYNLGFMPGRHEGKITGLAAYGNPKKTYPIYKKLMGVNRKNVEYRSGMKTWGRPAALKLHRMLQGHKREDIAAGVQKRMEDVCAELAGAAVERYGHKNIALAGGVFANVKVNQRIAELPGVEKVYIHPHMGDGGLGVGAALALWAEKMLNKGLKPKPIHAENVYFGPGFTDERIEKALTDAKLNFKRYEDVEDKIAHLLKEKKIVGRFNGRMEYGPRALGNRSILADPTDKTINDWLNKRLKRTEFMPFAPSLMKEHAENFYKRFGPGEVAAQFMTITFDVTEEGQEKAPAVNHIDNTARPQTVTKEQNKSYYGILKAYNELTGLPIFVNTSFNMHEEPIVCSPEDAARAFKLGSVDCLAIGNYIALP